MSTPRFATTSRQSAVAFMLASVMSFGLLSAMVTLADRAQADERLAQSAAQPQQVVVVAARAPRS